MLPNSFSAFFKAGFVDKIMDGSYVRSTAVQSEPEAAYGSSALLKGFKDYGHCQLKMLNCLSDTKCLGQVSTNLVLHKGVRIAYCFCGLGQDGKAPDLDFQ